MLQSMKRRLAEEQGIALITAMLVSMVVITLGATSVTLALHNSEQSAFDRRRVESIAAAEAGINYYFSHLQSGTADTFECSISDTLTATPTTQFAATVTFYDDAGNALPCPLTTQEPAAALIRSVGSSTSNTPSRAMEAYVGLVPVRGAPFGEYAIFSEGNPGFDSNVQVFGGESVQANVYTNGSAQVNSNTVIHGTLFAQGNVELNSNAEVKRTVHARGSVLLNSNARVLEDVISSTSSITLDSNAHVYGDARAGTTITVKSSAVIDGLRIPNSPSAPPPQETFPMFAYDAASWTSAGYTINNFSSCTSARTFIQGISSGNHVVRINATCSLSWSSNNTINVRGNLAIISNGSLSMNSNTKFQNVGSPHNLFLIFGVGQSIPCSAGNITFDSNFSIGAGIKTVLHTPCTIQNKSNSLVVDGQMFGGFVDFDSNANLTYTGIPVPGVGASGFEEDIQYIREVEV
jgi:hypothetical protein